MEQLSFVDIDIDKKTRQKTEKILSSYRNLEAIIESMEKDLPEQSVTVNYQVSESQRSNQFNSKVENVVMIRDKVHQKRIMKAKLDRIYKSLREVQQEIWQYRFMEGMFDDLVIAEIDISRRQYYREKSALIKVVAESFYFI